ncbi:Hypothetical protein CINCED_3A000984 [Cinara cedri]|uniref:Uncharacterized protein n=1 Tax=Cinara cedri TaxID=506608 RepID=A0A5E4MYY6_9HEMI|nr:Hypothetical protein CINCED_3A000984 [Cinara cedri]
MTKDWRWTKTLKCDIIKNITRLGNAEKCARLVGMDMILKNEDKYHEDLKRDIQQFKDETKKINTGNLTGIESRTRKERYGRLKPKEIKLSIWHSLNRINNESNLLINRISKIKKKLKNTQKRWSELQFNNQHGTDEKTKVAMGKMAVVDKKLALVDLNNRKTSEMVNYARQNLIVYDTLIEQLQVEVANMATAIMKEIEIGTMFKEDAANYTQSYIDQKLENEIYVNKEMFRVDQLNSIMDSLEHNRKKLMEEDPITELEETFYAKMPWTIDNEDELDETGSNPTKIQEETYNWTSKLLQFGLMYFVDKNQKLELLNGLKKCTSVIDYQFPENIADYIMFSDSSFTKDELATNYVLKRTEFSTIEDMTNYVECTKNDLIKLNKLNSVRKMLWSVLFKTNRYMKETSDTLNLVTIKEIELQKQIDMLKSYLDVQTNIMSDLCETKYDHYLTLLNDRHFYMNNLRSIFNKIKFSEEDTKRYSNLNTPQNEILGAPNAEILAYLLELKSMISKSEGKIRWCNLIILNDFNSAKLNLSRAIFDFKVQTHIQGDLLEKQIKFESDARRKVIPEITRKSDVILTREDTKKQAELILKYFAEKDTDSSKNRRKPMTFRREFL